MATMYGVTLDLTMFPDQAIFFDGLKAEFAAKQGFTAVLLRSEVKGQEVDLWFDRPINSVDFPLLTAVCMTHRAALSVIKAAKFAAIDKVTDTLIAMGFPFNGMQFSSSLEAQSRALGMDQLRNDPMFTYPVKWNSMDDEAVLTLSTPDEVHAFVLTGIGAYRQAIDSGTALKEQVRAATTIEEAHAVADTRIAG